MRKTISLLLMVVFVLVSVSAMAQPAKRNLNWFNRNYIFGAQDKDAEGNPMWNTDGTPRLGPVKSWTGAFNDYTEVDGVRTYNNPDGNPFRATNLEQMYGNGSVYGGNYLTRYAWWDRGGGKIGYHYPNRDWSADRNSAGKDPISAATPVILNCDFEAVYDWADFCVWNYTGNQRYEWYFRAAKDVTVKYKVAEGDPWETLGTYVMDYSHTVNTNNYGAYRVANHVYSPMSLFAAGSDTRTDEYHAHRNGGPWSQPLPIEAGHPARYVQFEIASNWAQGLENDPKRVGFNELTFYKTGAMLAFDGPFDVAPMRSEEYVLPYESGKGPAGDRDDPNIDWTQGDIELWSMGGWPRFWDEGLGDYTTVTYNDVTITNFGGSALAEGGAWVADAPETPFVLQGNHQAALGVVFQPPTFGEFAEDLTVEWTLPQEPARTYQTTFSLTGKGVHNAWGYIPIYGGKEAASVGGWSDWGYAWRLDYGQNGGAIDEHPDLGWIRGTRLATARHANSYNSDGGTGVDGMWHKLNLGRTFETGEVDEMWVWPSRWYANNSMKNVEIHVSNDPEAYANDQSIPDFQANGADHTGWIKLSDEEFPMAAAPWTVQHKVDFSSAPPFQYVKITCKGGPGAGTQGGGNVSLAKVRFFQKDAVLHVSPDRIDWPELDVYSTTETQIVVGNVGDEGHDMTIESIDFVTDRGWTGGGFFSLPTVPSMGLPKVYAAGTTEALILRYNPLDFGEHKARFLVNASNMDGKTNAWEIECTGKVYEYAPGFIRDVTATANASHNNAGWDEMQAVNGAGVVEYPDALHRGSKQARHSIGNNSSWLAGTTQRISEAWIECDLGGVNNLEELWVWNYAQGANYDAQVKTVYIEYREDEGDSWRQLGGDDMFYTFFGTGARFANNPFPATNLAGDGDADETNNPPLDFGGVAARYVRISTAGGHDVGSYGDSRYAVGLGELRFYSSAGDVRVSPDVMNFGSVANGATKTNTFDIENESGSPLTVDLVVPLGLNSPFNVTTPGPFEVQAGGAQTVQVEFAPTENGKWANNKVAVIGSFGVFYVTVHGQSFIAGTPDVEIDPMSVNFGTVYLPRDGSAPAPVDMAIDVMNWGDVALAVSDIETTNTSYPEGSDMAFTADKTDLTVAADASPTVAGMGAINVSFVPLVAGNFSGQVILTSNDPDESPATVTLSGRAVVTQPAAVDGDDWMLY